MNITSMLHKIANRIAGMTQGPFAVSFEEQRRYLYHFREPIDNIERSYFQYRCQMKLNRNVVVTFLMNFVSLPLLLFFYYKQNDATNSEVTMDTVAFLDGKASSIIPSELINECGNIQVIEKKAELLTREDKSFFFSIVRRYPFSWHFLLKILIKIRYYSYQINTYNPTKIIACNEYSFTCSVITEFCNHYGVEHINVMHGEKLFYIRDSFVSFDRFYVWDSYYEKLFNELRAKTKQFIVDIPDSLRFKISSKKRKKFDYIYYLGSESGESLDSVFTQMEELCGFGYKVAIRPHPRYTNPAWLKNEALSHVILEDAKQVSIENSVLSTKNVISLYSTVLNQAYNNGVGVVIDNVSQRDRYQKLLSLKYIMMMKPHILLSDLLEKDEQK